MPLACDWHIIHGVLLAAVKNSLEPHAVQLISHAGHEMYLHGLTALRK